MGKDRSVPYGAVEWRWDGGIWNSVRPLEFPFIIAILN